MKVVLDSVNQRFIYSPLPNNKQISVGAILRAIRNNFPTLDWKFLTNFLGLKNSSEVFKVTYVGNISSSLKAKVQDLLVIDQMKNEAYLYSVSNKPEVVKPPHVGPLIVGVENSYTVKTGVPTKIASRLKIKEAYDKFHTMRIRPTGGYILYKNSLPYASDTEIVISGTVKTLNEVLTDINFMAVTEGSGNVVISVDDNMREPSSITSTTISITIERGEAVSIPVINLPEEKPSVSLKNFCSFTPVTVSDDDNKLLTLKMTPFDCNIAGFKTYLFSVKPGKMRTVQGTPEYLNEEIAKLKVYPLNEKACIGIQLICGKTKLTEYLNFEVDMSGAPMPEELIPDMTQATSSYDGVTGESTPMGIQFTGERTDNFTVEFHANGASLTGFTSNASENVSKKTITGTIEQINREIANAKVVFGEEETGSVNVSYCNLTSQIPVNTILDKTNLPEPNTTCALAEKTESINLGEEYALNGVTFTGTRTYPFIVKITPKYCSISGLKSAPGESYTDGQSVQITGTISEINAELATAKATLEDNALIEFEYLEKKTTIVINVVKPETEEPEGAQESEPTDEELEKMTAPTTGE